MKALLALCLSISAMTAFAQEPFGFKKYIIGSEFDSEALKTVDAPYLCGKPNPLTLPFKCVSQYPRRETVGGARAQAVRLEYVDLRLAVISIEFDSAEFGLVLKALVDRRGKPGSFDSKTYQNAFGATRKSIEAGWIDAGNAIRLVQYYSTRKDDYGGTLDQSLIVFYSIDGMQKIRAANDRSHERAADF